MTLGAAFGRFLLLGAVSFGLNLAITAGLHERLAATEELAFLVALAVVLVVNFSVCRRFVFRSTDRDTARQFREFVLSSIAFRGAEYLAFLGVHSWFQVHYLLAATLILAASTAVKFVFYRGFVFRDASVPEGKRFNLSHTAIHAIMLAALTALVFSNTFQGELNLDSVYRVEQNPALERFWPPWRHFFDPRTSASIPQLVQYRPLLPLSLSLDLLLADSAGLPRLAIWHATNIALHAAAAWFLYLLLLELMRLRPPGVAGWVNREDLAFAAALLFAVHPVSGVPVNYVAGRDESLMLLFLLAALWLYARMRRRGGSLLGWIGSLTLFALSLGAKQNGLVAPALVLGIEWLFIGASLRVKATWHRVAAWAAVIVGFFVWTEVFLGFSDLDQLQAESGSAWVYACTMLETHVFYYLRNFVWPFRMRALPQIEPIDSLLAPGVLVGLAVVGGSAAAAIALRRRAPVIAFSIFAYWTLFATTSSFRPFRYFANDYRQYASLGFLCAIVVLLLAKLPSRKAAIAAWFVLAAYFGASSLSANRIWRTAETLWAQSVRFGGAPLAHMNYAQAIQSRDPDLAERHYREALAAAPEMVYARINLGLLQIWRGRQAEGLAEVRRAVDSVPDWAIAHYWYAEALRQVGDTAGATEESRIAADLDPRNLDYQYRAALELQRAGRTEESLPFIERVADSHPDRELTGFLLGFALQSVGRWSEAEASYRAFLSRQPAHAGAWFNLGFGLKEESRDDEARAAFEETLRLEPGHSAARYWLDALEHPSTPAPVAATVGSDDMSGAAVRRGLAFLDRGEFDDAIAEFRRATEIDSSSVAAWYDLGLALLRAGRIIEAVPACSQAAALAPENLDARHNFGYALRVAGRTGDAIAIFREVLVAEPRRVITLFELGAAYVDAGRREEARTTFQGLLRVDPDHGAARERLAELDR